MAIKGKGRTRGGRTVAAAPRPAYVVRKRPLFLRRGFQIGLGLFLLAAVAAGVVAGILVNRSRERTEQERDAVAQFGTLVDGSLRQVGPALPPTGFQPFPRLRDTIQRLEKGGISTKEAVGTTTGFQTSARAAYTRIEQIQAAELVREEHLPVTLLDTQSMLVQSLQIYERLAKTVGFAAQSSGEERRRLLEVAKGLIPVAEELFDDGYQKLTNERARLGILVPNFGPPPGLLPTPSPKGQAGGGGGGGQDNNEGQNQNGDQAENQNNG